MKLDRVVIDTFCPAYREIPRTWFQRLLRRPVQRERVIYQVTDKDGVYYVMSAQVAEQLEAQGIDLGKWEYQK